jgi:O-antigen/teichoic acid export membrane protein
MKTLRRPRLRDDTLSRKATLNMAAAMLDYGARVIVGLIVAPVLVSRLGDLAYGVYQTLGRLVGYATPAGGRPSQALKWTIARHQQSDAYDEKRIQVGSAVAVWLVFLPPLALAGGVLAWFAPNMLGLPDSLHLTVRVAAGLLVVNLIVENFTLIPQSVVQGENLGYKRLGSSALIVFAGGGLTVIAAQAGWGLVGVAAALAATTVATGVLFLQVARRHISWFGAARPPRGVVRGFLTLSGWFLLWNLVMQLLRASDIVVLGIAGSPQQVTVYSLSRYVPEAIFSVVAIAISAVMPGLGGVMGAGETERAARVRSEAMTFTWLLATASGAAYLLIQSSFLEVWVGEKYVPAPMTALLIVVMTLQFAFIRNDSSIIDLTLELKSKVLLGLVAGAASVGLAVLFIKTFDDPITGLALGFVSGRAIIGIAYPVTVCRTLGQPLGGQIRGAVRPLLVTGVFFAGALLLAPSLEVGSWLGVLGLGAVALAVSGALALFAGLSREQRARVTDRARAIRRCT